MYENAFNEYASDGRKRKLNRKVFQKIMACKINNSVRPHLMHASKVPKFPKLLDIIEDETS